MSKKKIFVEVNGGMVVSVYTKDFEIDEIEFCVIDRDMQATCEESRVTNELFNVIQNDDGMIEIYETEEVS